MILHDELPIKLLSVHADLVEEVLRELLARAVAVVALLVLAAAQPAPLAAARPRRPSCQDVQLPRDRPLPAPPLAVCDGARAVDAEHGLDLLRDHVQIFAQARWGAPRQECDFPRMLGVLFVLPRPRKIFPYSVVV